MTARVEKRLGSANSDPAEELSVPGAAVVGVTGKTERPQGKPFCVTKSRVAACQVSCCRYETEKPCAKLTLAVAVNATRIAKTKPTATTTQKRRRTRR